MTADRAVRAFEDVVAVERMAPGMVRVVTWSDAYPIDARGEGCNCPDNEYNLAPGELCKHEYAALAADVDTLPSPGIQTDNLDARAVADGGERPDDCNCHSPDQDLPCWPCVRDGFDEPNPDPDDPIPTRSEPADFGGGESTGVQDL